MTDPGNAPEVVHGPATLTAPTPAPAPAKKLRKEKEQTRIKETVEQILIAFILAFIFRAYVVEAFVIPTGSMAPTLLGAHLRYRCPDCGYRFTVNYGAEGEGDDLFVPAAAVMRGRTNGRPDGKEYGRTYAIHCPNCGYRLPPTLPADPANDAFAPPVQYGDRILVLKYLYLLHDPQAWDVVVFKNPSGQQDRNGDWTPDYSQNYIKRLVGLPGETLMVLDGDIYAATAGTRDPATLKPSDFTIKTKPYDAQQAMWRVVFDNDYQPRGLKRQAILRGGRPEDDPAWVDPWQPAGGSGWNLKADGGRTLTFDGKGTGTLAFDSESDLIRNWASGYSNDIAWRFTDWLAYNVTWNQGEDPRKANLSPQDADTSDFGGYQAGTLRSNVSDVKLALDYRRKAGAGPLKLVLTKEGATFTATLLPGKVSLTVRQGNGPEVPVGGGPKAVNLGSSVARVEFINADYRVALRIDGKEILATTPAEYAPDVAKKLADFRAGRPEPKATVKIEAADQTAELQHVRLYRDVFYNNQQLYGRSIIWGSPEDFPARLITLGPTDYWTLGDNSLISADARVWTEPVSLPNENLQVKAGRVPKRFLLGKAFFVYWPAGYRPTSGLPALVPNFGDMRFIK